MTDASASLAVGAVVIGRNEGERLRRCLASVVGRVRWVIYVDSGSSDGSARLARSLGVEVVELDASRPFTAARGRNAGLERLLQTTPDIEHVQFVDGDCELSAGWIEHAVGLLESRAYLAAVCGRLRERHPEASIYNRLCDMEWDRPAGETTACGGIAMMRVAALRQAGGFREDLAAGEEPELCLRLRQAGWRIWRDGTEMATHDAAMTAFGQWWRRAVRSGYGYAEGSWRYGTAPERYCVRPLASMLLWGGCLPLIVPVGLWLTGGLAVVLLVLYPLLWWRIARSQRARGQSGSDAQLYATFTILAKFAQLAGALRWLATRLSRQQARLIEYKTAAKVASQ